MKTQSFAVIPPGISTRRISPLAASIAALLLAALPARAQTYTSPNSGTFTNPLVWNFGAGPVPVSDAALALGLQTYGAFAITVGNDLNLTLNKLNLATYGSGALTLSNAALNGDFAFTGGAGTVNLLGSGAATVLSAGVVLGEGLTSLTFDGAGASGLTVSGVISSNTTTGAPVIIATDAGHSGTGVITLSGANTFAGGVVLNSGTLSLGHTRALGDAANTLIINGGNLRTTTATVAGNVTLNSTLNFTGGGNLTLSGRLSGVSGVASHAGTTGNALILTGINTYTGTTTIGVAAATDSASILRISGATGSILSTSGLSVTGGGVLELNYGNGNSAANTRVSTGSTLNVQSGSVQIIGGLGLVGQNLGTVQFGGLTDILAGTISTFGSTAFSATEVAIANLHRNPGGTVTFAGVNLGASGFLFRRSSIQLTQINGSAPGGFLVGGGGLAGTPTVSILPWALGDNSPGVTNFIDGIGFVTHGATGVRQLNALTEYNLGNNFTTVGATENMRVTGPVTNPVAPVTVNSLSFGSASQTVGGGNVLTITSGALASNVATATISAPLNFGLGGGGEGIVSVVGPLNTINVVTLSGNVTAAALVKSGHGRLVLSGAGNTITGSLTINGGQVEVSDLAQLGGATSLRFFGHSSAASRAELRYTGAGPAALAVPVATHSGMAGFTNASGVLSITSSISGAGGLRFDGAGTRVLAGTNTYAGATYLGDGITQIDSDARFGSTANPLASFLGFAGGTLQLTGDWTSSRAITVNAASTLDVQTNAANLSGPILGTVALTKLGAGPLTISGADNGYSGAITLGNAATPGGTLALAAAGTLNSAKVVFGTSGGPAGTYLLDLSGATAVNGTPWRSFAALDTATGFTQAHAVRLGLTTLTPVDLRVRSGSFGGPGGVISGFGKLVKTGTDTLILDSANSFTGGVEIWGGVLQATEVALGHATNSVTIQGGTFRHAGNFMSTRTFFLGTTLDRVGVSQTNTISGVGGTMLLAGGTISGPGGFNHTATLDAVLSLEGMTNTYAGDTQISSGTVSFSSNANLGAASSRVFLVNGALAFTAAPASPATLALPRTIFVTNSASTLLVTDANATLELAGPVLSTLNSTLTKNGAGQLLISGDNTSFFGLLQIGSNASPNGGARLAGAGQLRGGTISLSGTAAATFDLGGLARELNVVNLNAGTTLALGAGGRVTSGLTGGMVWNGSVTGDSAASFTKVGVNALTLASGTNTFSGGFHLLSGPATFSGNGALPLQSAFTVGAWGNAANGGPRLLLNNTATNLGTRLADAQVIHSNAGEIQFTTNATAATSETLGSLRGAGMTTITMTTGGTLHFGDAASGLTRVAGGTFLFRAGNANLGTAAATTAIANLTFGNLPGTQLLGGGTGAGTPTISILPYAVGDITAAGSGSNFVTYDANGIRVLNTTTEVVTRTNTGSLPGTASAENLRFANSALTTTQLTGGTDLVVNSLAIAGSASTTRIESAGTEKLILESGALLNTVNNVFAVNPAGTAAVTLGIQTGELQTGAGNTRELQVFTTGGDLALGAKVTTTGGLTKSGAAQLFLTNSANTYTGPTTVNAGNLVIDDLSVLGGSAVLQLGGGFFRYRGGDATLAQNVVATGGEAANPIGGSAGFHIIGGTTLTIPGGGISGYGGLLKDGTGVLKLDGANSYSGATIIGGGALAIATPGALGSHGRVIFADGVSPAGGQTLRFDAPMTLTQDFITNSAEAGVGFGFDTNGHDVTLSGTLLSTTSTRGLYKYGSGELHLTATEMSTGATQIFGGTLRLSGAAGSILNSGGNASGVLIARGTALVLDNLAFNNNNRLPDVWDTPFGSGLVLNGGELRIIGHATGTRERVNQVNITLGTITLENAGTSLTSGLFNRATSTSGGLVRGTNLGGVPGATSTNWFVTDLGSGGVALSGAGGAEGTPFVNILPGFMGAASAAGSGSDFLTYASDRGFRLLAQNEYAASLPAGNFDPNRAPNVALTGPAAVTLATTISALKLSAGASLGGSGTVVLASGTVLATGSASIDVPVLRANATIINPGYVFLTPGGSTTLTVNSFLPSGGLAKYGEGLLVLNGGVHGDLEIGQGTLRLGAAPAAYGKVFVAPGATFDLNGQDRIIGGLNNTSFIASLAAASMGQVADGLVSLGANRLTLSGAAYFTGAIIGSGGLTTGHTSTGSTFFFQPLAYTGSTIILRGNFELAGQGSLASTSVEIRGGSLIFNNAGGNAAAGGYLANRLGTSVPITLAGGDLTILENTHTPANHQLGTVTLEGAATITVTSGAAAPSTTTFANLTRSAKHGTLSVTATNFGFAPSPAGNVRLLATQIDGGLPGASLLGGGGAAGSTTVSILPWARSHVFGTPLTYGADGLRPLRFSELASDLNAPVGGTSANVATTTVQTLTADCAVNFLHAGADVSGAFDLTLGSGGLFVSANPTFNVTTIGNTAKNLSTGAGNTRELVVTVFNDFATLNYRVSTTGGVTKTGKGELTLAGTNTFTGGLTINDGRVLYSNDSQLGAAGGLIRFGDNLADGTAGLTDSNLTYTGGGPFAFNRPIETNGFGYLAGAGTQRFLINQPISGSGGIGYTHNGVFEINTVNTYTGATRMSSGYLYIKDDSAFGNGGDLYISGTIVLRGGWQTNRLTQISAIQTNGFAATLGGHTLAIPAKSGQGTLFLTAASTAQGFTVNAGEIRLQGNGSLAANSNVPNAINAGAILTLDNTDSPISDRLDDNTGRIVMSGGEFRILGNSNTTIEEVIPTLEFPSFAASTVSVAAGGGRATLLRLSTAPTLGPGSTEVSLWRGTNLGVHAPGTPNTASILLLSTSTTAFPLVGGAAPNGHPSISIIRGGFGDTNATGLGTQLVTYDAVKGVRLLDPATEYTTTLVNGSAVTDNVKADGTTLTLTSATTANALWLKDGGAVNGTGELTLTTGNLLVTGAGNSLTNPLTATAALAVGGPGDVTISSALSGVSSLVKRGAGILTLTSPTTITKTLFAEGAIALGSSGALGTFLHEAEFQGGEVRNVSGGPLTLDISLKLNGTMKVGGTQHLTFSSSVSLANATREIEVTNTGLTTLSGVISASQNFVSYGLTKTGPGLLVLANAANTYDGETTVRAGELRVTGNIAASALTTVDGGTLSGTGTVGKLTLETGVLAPGASAGLLNSGDLLFSGGIFAVEIASAVLADKMNVAGTAGLAANTELDVLTLGGFNPQIGNRWVIVNNDGRDPFTTGSFRFTNDGVPIENLIPFAIGPETYVLEYNSGSGNDVVLRNVANVPEPGSAALLLTGLPLLLRRIRRR